LRERDHLENLGVNSRKILKWMFKNWGEDMDWIDLVQDRDGRRAVINTVMNLRVPLNSGNFFNI
jgi:hypothetical protein